MGRGNPDWLQRKLAGASSSAPGAGTEYAGIYLHARYFDPALGLFLSPDPMDPAHPGVGTNRYSYAFGNPVNATDRFGSMLDLQCREKSRHTRAGPPEESWMRVTVVIECQLVYIPDPVDIRQGPVQPHNPFDRRDPADRDPRNKDPKNPKNPNPVPPDSACTPDDLTCSSRGPDQAPPPDMVYPELFDSPPPMSFGGCVERSTFSNVFTLGAHAANTAANASVGPTGNYGHGLLKSHPTSWQHVAEMKGRWPAWAPIGGKLAGRAMVTLTIAEGFWDWAAILGCAAASAAE